METINNQIMKIPRSKTDSTLLCKKQGKKKSKISLKLSQLDTRANVNEYEELIKEDNELYGDDNEENYIESENLNIKKFKILLHYYITIGENNFHYETNLILESNQKVEDIIIWGINSFNNMNNRVSIQDKEFILKYNNNSSDDFKSYEIRNCKKKNFKPKFDLPPYSNNTLVENVSEERLCLVCKNKNLLIMKQDLSNNDSDEKLSNESRFCSKCFIF